MNQYSAAERTESGILDRFYSKTKRAPNGCLEWTGHINGDGYGQFRWNGKLYGAHKIAHALEYGDPPAGTEILHSCDNKKCVDIFHLRADTHKQNMGEAGARGRLGHGRLSEESVRDIRRLSPNCSTRDLAIQLGVCSATIRAVVNRKTWKNVE